jgi:hypothetical protein
VHCLRVNYIVRLAAIRYQREGNAPLDRSTPRFELCWAEHVEIRATDKRRKMFEFKEYNARDARKMHRDSAAEVNASDCASGDRHACSARSTNA